MPLKRFEIAIVIGLPVTHSGTSLIMFVSFSFAPCLFILFVEKCNSGSAKRRCGEPFSDIQIREFNKHYPSYSDLTLGVKRSLAASLGVSLASMNSWMYKKRKKERDISKPTLQHQNALEHGKNDEGMITLVILP